MNEQIEALAKELGQNIARSEIYMRYRNAASVLNGAPAELDLVHRFTRVTGVITEKNRNAVPVDPDEVELAGKLAAKMQESGIIAEYLESQADFAAMMDELMRGLEEAGGTV